MKMAGLKEVVTKNHEYTIDELERYCCKQQPKSLSMHHDRAIKILTAILKENRFTLIGSYSPFSIVVNGYHEFKCIQTKEYLAKDSLVVSAKEIFERIRLLPE